MTNSGHIIVRDGRTDFDRSIEEAARLYCSKLAATNPLPEFDKGSGLYDIPTERPPEKLNIEATIQLVKAYVLSGVKVKATYTDHTGRLDIVLTNETTYKHATMQFHRSAPLFENTIRAMVRNAAEGIR